MKLKILVLFLLYSVLIGCAGPSVIEGYYSMEGSNSYDINNESKIIVAVNKDFGYEGNTETSTNFLYSFVRALKENGFKNVFSYEDYLDEKLEADYFVLVNLFKQVSDSDTIARNFMEALGLDPASEGVAIAREYQTVQYYMFLNWLAKNKTEPFITHDVILYESPCTDYASYKFLIYRAAEEINFHNEEEYDFKEVITKTNNCAVFNSPEYY